MSLRFNNGRKRHSSTAINPQKDEVDTHRIHFLQSSALDIEDAGKKKRRLVDSCHLGVRVFDNKDGSNSYDCFCELHGEDRNPKKKGPNRVMIKSSDKNDETDHCEGMMLNLAATNEYEIFLDAVIDDDKDELRVESWSPMTSMQTHEKQRDKKKEGKKRRSESSDDGRFLRDNGRNLQQIIDWSLLVVNVGGKDYDAPSTDAQLADDWFQDSASLRTQIAECSSNKMTFSPRVGKGITDGVMTVSLNQNLKGLPVRRVETIVLEELANRGIVLDPDSDEKIALCFPENSFRDDRVYGGAGGYAVPNGNLAAFRGEFCNKVSTQMHEIGHTLGLQHSGDLVDTSDPLPGERIFGDYTGAMGGWHSPDDAEICYNAAKMWQLGWRPAQDITPGSFETDLTLTSFADWDGDDATICIARVVTPDTFYFVHYNRQVGSNADVQEYGDKIIVTKRSSLDGIANILSQIVAVLDDDDDSSLEVEDAGRSGFDMVITVGSIAFSTADVSISMRSATPAPMLPPSVVALAPTAVGTLSPITSAPASSAPATHAPVTGAPVTNAPVTRAPATNAPVTNAPISNAPATGSPVTNAPATSAPATNAPVSNAPVTHAPVTSAPVTDAPVTNAPVTIAPVTRAPATIAPVTSAPITGAPATVAPVTNAPVTSSPATNAPVSSAPVTSAPVTTAPATDAPVTSAPATDAPVTSAPVTSAPATDASVTDAPVTSSPVTSSPVTSAPTTDAPVTSAPATGAPGSDAPVTSAPATDTPVTSAPVTSAPATGAPISTARLTKAPVTSLPSTTSSNAPTSEPTNEPTKTLAPTNSPTKVPTKKPTTAPTELPTPHPTPTPDFDTVVKGYVDGPSGTIGVSYTINGWACQSGYTQSIQIRVYLGGKAGQGQFFKSILADQGSEPAVAAACQGTGTTYRYRIPISQEEAIEHGGETVFVHGISIAGTENTLLHNSGDFTIPTVASPTAPAAPSRPTKVPTARPTRRPTKSPTRSPTKQWNFFSHKKDENQDEKKDDEKKDNDRKDIDWGKLLSWGKD